MSKLKRFLKQNLFTVISLAVAVGILFFFLFKDNDLQALSKGLRTLQWGWVLLALAAEAGMWLLEGAGNMLLCRHLYRGWSYGRSFMAGMTSLFYSAITPFSAGGQPMQIYYMSKMGMEPGNACAVISVKSITHQAVTVLLSLALIGTQLPFFQSRVSNLSFLTLIGVLANLLFLAAVILVSLNSGIVYRVLRWGLRLLHRLRVVKDPEKKYESITGQLDIFHESFKKMGRNWKLYLLVCVVTLVQQIVFNSVTYCIYRAFGLSGSTLWTLMAAQVFTNLVAALVPLPGAAGSSELSFAAFMGLFFGGATGPAMVLWRVMTYYICLPCGFLSVYLGAKRYVGTAPQKEYQEIIAEQEQEDAPPLP